MTHAVFFVPSALPGTAPRFGNLENIVSAISRRIRYTLQAPRSSQAGDLTIAEILDHVHTCRTLVYSCIPTMEPARRIIALLVTAGQFGDPLG